MKKIFFVLLCLVSTNSFSQIKIGVDIIKPFDIGFNVLAGVEFKGFQLTARYSRSFSEIYSDDGYNYKNASFEFSIAYSFSLKK